VWLSTGSQDLVPELPDPTEQLRRIDVVTARHVRDHDTGLQRLGNDRNFCLVRPLPPAFDAVQHLNPAGPNGLDDVVMDVNMVVSIRAHGSRRSHDPLRSRHVRSRHRLHTCRTICFVAATQGRGEGAWVETLRFTNSGEPEAFRSGLVGSVIPSILEQPGIIGVHLMVGETAASQGASAEKNLRKQPDEIADWVLLIEAVEEQDLRRNRDGAASDGVFRHAAGEVSAARGIYRLQFALTKSEIDRGVTAPERWA